MAKDLTVVLEDRPGTLADLGEALGNAGINIEGISGIPCEGKGLIHVLVNDSAGARDVLTKAGIKVESERDVLVLDIEDRPGVFGRFARKIAVKGVNINLVYLATSTRLVVGVDDLEMARSVL